MGKSNKFSLTTKSHSSSRVNPYDKINLNALNVTCPDKQIVLPKLENNGVQHVSLELYSLFIFIIALGTQYLNLYRSVWWLSKTRSNQPINFHLIDLDVSQFSLILIGQSSLITILKALLSRATLTTNLTTNSNNNHNSNTTATNNSKQQQQHQLQQHANSNNISCTTSPSATSNNSNTINASNNNTALLSSSTSELHQQQNVSTTTTKSSIHSSNSSSHFQSTIPSSENQISIEIIVTALASWTCNYYLFKSAYRIFNNFGLNGLSCISYPIVVSIIMNSTQIIQIVDGCRKAGKLDSSILTLSVTLFSSHITFNDEKLCHTCSNQPDDIRDEVERLRTIFNERLKFVLFKSILLAYYSSFVPICFAQSFLYYDYTWTAQHVIITWFSSLIMLISSSYTPHFYDVLHRSAYHFGKWQKLEARNTLVPCISWSENMIYPQGKCVVKLTK